MVIGTLKSRKDSVLTSIHTQNGIAFNKEAIDG